MTDDPAETTEALVTRATAGDRAAFAQLVAACRDRLLAQIRSRMGQRVRSAMGVEDVFQETIARALDAIAKLRWQGEESFYRWLAGIAEHLIQNASQRKSLDALRLTRDVPATGATPSRAAQRDERFDRLERAMDELTPEQRTALKLARIDGLAVRRIATKMGRSEKAVYALLSRALERLRETFGDTESLGLPDRVFRSREDVDGAP